RLVRVIVLSQTYQRGAGAGKETDSTTDPGQRYRKLRSFARFPVRPLSVDQLYQSIVQATGHQGEEEAGEMEEGQDGYSDKPTELLGERAFTVQRSLALLNSDYVHEAVKAGAKAALAVHGRPPGTTHVAWLFQATLTRRPTDAETAAMLKLIRGAKK